jgi:hypothetical protein
LANRDKEEREVECLTNEGGAELISPGVVTARVFITGKKNLSEVTDK